MTDNAVPMPAGAAASASRAASGASPTRYHPALVALHWIIAALIFVTAYLALGPGGEGSREARLTIAGLPLIGIHMILGLLVLVLLLVRLVIRWRTAHPTWATVGSPLLDRIGVLTHWGLYFFTFAITITGLVLALQTNRLARVFNPGASSQFAFRPPASEGVPPGTQFRSGNAPREGFRPGGSEGGEFEGGFSPFGRFFLGAFHGLSWIFLLLLIILHAGAALYHQFIRRDGLLARMWFGRRYA